MEKRANRKLLYPGIVLILLLSAVCVLVYKAQFRDGFAPAGGIHHDDRTQRYF